MPRPPTRIAIGCRRNLPARSARRVPCRSARRSAPHPVQRRKKSPRTIARDGNFPSDACIRRRSFRAVRAFSIVRRRKSASSARSRAAPCCRQFRPPTRARDARSPALARRVGCAAKNTRRANGFHCSTGKMRNPYFFWRAFERRYARRRAPSMRPDRRPSRCPARASSAPQRRRARKKIRAVVDSVISRV